MPPPAKRLKLHGTVLSTPSPLTALAFSPSGEHLAAGTSLPSLQLFDVPSLHPSAVLLRPSDEYSSKSIKDDRRAVRGVNALAWSPAVPCPTGKPPTTEYLAAGTDADYLIRIWAIAPAGDAGLNVSTAHTGGAEQDTAWRVLKGHAGEVHCVAWDPMGKLMVSGGMDETVRLWDVQEETCLKSLYAHSQPVSAVEFSPDGSMFISGSWDGYIRIWDAATGNCLKTLASSAEDNTPISNIGYTPNGAFIFAATLDSTIRLWDYLSERCVKTYAAGHRSVRFNLSLALSSNGAVLYTGSEDGSVVLYDVQTRAVEQKIKEAHSDVVLCLSVCRSGEWEGWVASGGGEQDRTIRIWEPAQEGEIIDSPVKVNGYAQLHPSPVKTEVPLPDEPLSPSKAKSPALASAAAMELDSPLSAVATGTSPSSVAVPATQSQEREGTVVPDSQGSPELKKKRGEEMEVDKEPASPIKREEES